MFVPNHHSLPGTYKEMCEVTRKYEQARSTVAPGRYRYPTVLKNEENQIERISQWINGLSINRLETVRTMNEMIQNQQRNTQPRRDACLDEERNRYRREGRCFTCGEPGHRSYECLSEKTDTWHRATESINPLGRNPPVETHYLDGADEGNSHDEEDEVYAVARGQTNHHNSPYARPNDKEKGRNRLRQLDQALKELRRTIAMPIDSPRRRQQTPHPTSTSREGIYEPSVSSPSLDLVYPHHRLHPATWKPLSKPTTSGLKPGDSFRSP
ncbi:hypothetical protein BX616_008114 [Lobosporangium transversale]|uniref:CCHC-type domain-containing protein n=1 Tax=Lobosporangium transversale TaxID=64571 RepID=A0A1Y2GTK4_9FUNG|nr:hypothetical protein BCR41DRAFT_395075 [Lobosporangium transversale]KAF9918534.1 hypothetical protein BX616_008114 [Lobosporangium transversale]ORZ20060.1 hypothetical protein BCR41DRAFT_395075 [Lobosporangium transversale]|eukprot:XP_021882600.1 hypothetical protein BCR41DRAFT_395075 [Lobosporangium transversale]